MTAADLVRDLQERGVTLVADGGTLRFRPKSALTESDLAALTAMKAEVLATLERPTPSRPSGPVTCYCCRGHRFWMASDGHTVYARCHPPADPSFVSKWITADETANA